MTPGGPQPSKSSKHLNSHLGRAQELARIEAFAQGLLTAEPGPPDRQRDGVAGRPPAGGPGACCAT